MESDVYYGTTNTGKRIHFGNILLYPEANNASKWVVQSLCGRDITEANLDEPLPTRVDEYCRACFRAIAWRYFTESMRTQNRDVRVLTPYARIELVRAAERKAS